MKIFLIIFIFCFAALQLGKAGKHDDTVKSCLIKHGFKATDLDKMKSMGRPEFTDISKDISKEKLACVIACIYRKDRKASETRQPSITEMGIPDDPFWDNQQKEMLDALNYCYPQIGDDDCQLLHCIKSAKSPLSSPIAAN